MDDNDDYRDDTYCNVDHGEMTEIHFLMTRLKEWAHDVKAGKATDHDPEHGSSSIYFFLLKVTFLFSGSRCNIFTYF